MILVLQSRVLVWILPNFDNIVSPSAAVAASSSHSHSLFVISVLALPSFLCRTTEMHWPRGNVHSMLETFWTLRGNATGNLTVQKIERESNQAFARKV